MWHAIESHVDAPSSAAKTLVDEPRQIEHLKVAVETNSVIAAIPRASPSGAGSLETGDEISA
jgi:hypothetical protein